MCRCVMKRTTLILEDSCIRAIHELARKTNRQISQVVNELLVEGIQRRKHQGRPEGALKLPTFSMGRPRANLGDRNALEAVMDS